MIKEIKFKNIVRWSILFITISIFMLTGSNLLLGQETNNIQKQKQKIFLDELSSILIQHGWNPGYVENMILEAKNLNWKDADQANPEITALTLQYMKKENMKLEPLEQAQFALQIALNEVEMQKMGYNDHEVASIVLNGVRNMLSDIQTWKQNGKVGNLGKIVRNQIKNEIRNTEIYRMHEQANQRNREQNRDISENCFKHVPSKVSPSNPEGGRFNNRNNR